ncbi:unnamed protein product [Symbiodinium sp. CCMP2456]|nr:unnamed protein product [Symbiodinium sp. CCMP2456]
MSQDYPCSDLLPEWAAPHSWRLQEGLPLHGREAGRHPGWRHRPSADKDSGTSAQGWRVTHWESKSLLGYCQAVNRQFDFVDVDASGCWSHIGATLELVRPGEEWAAVPGSYWTHIKQTFPGFSELGRAAGQMSVACSALPLASEAGKLLREGGGSDFTHMRPTETLHDHMARALIWRASASLDSCSGHVFLLHFGASNDCSTPGMVSAADSLGLIAQPLFSLYRGAGLLAKSSRDASSLPELRSFTSSQRLDSLQRGSRARRRLPDSAPCGPEIW